MIAYLKEGRKEPGHEAGVKWMKGVLANIDVLISHVLQMMNESVSWTTIPLIVAGGSERVHSMPANTDANYVMSSFGIEICVNNVHRFHPNILHPGISYNLQYMVIPIQVDSNFPHQHTHMCSSQWVIIIADKLLMS
jgi:hypothetical protein